MDIPSLSPYMIRLGFLQIRWYGVFMALSMAVGLWYLVREGIRRGIEEDHLYNWGLISIVGGVVGARLVFVLTNPGYFLHYPAQIPMIQLGGLSIHGALLGGVGAGWWYARRRGIPLQVLFDLGVPGIAMGIALVRIGNIFNHEILGFHAGILGGARHPVQLYESALGLGLLLLFAHQSRRRPVPADGIRFWSAIYWYTIVRFVTESFREQNPSYLVHYTLHYLGMGGITLTQWFSPFIFAFVVIALRRARRRDAHWGPGDAALAAAPAGVAALGAGEVPETASGPTAALPDPGPGAEATGAPEATGEPEPSGAREPRGAPEPRGEPEPMGPDSAHPADMPAAREPDPGDGVAD